MLRAPAAPGILAASGLMVLLLSQTYRRPTVDLSSDRVLCGAACESAWREHVKQVRLRLAEDHRPTTTVRLSRRQHHSARRAMPRMELGPNPLGFRRPHSSSFTVCAC